MRAGRIFYLFVLLLCVFDTARLWNIMPPEMAAHFNVVGAPDRFVPKPEFFWFQLQTLLIVLLVSLLPQILFYVIPAGWINMPHREYWLSPEHRDETVGRLSDFGATLFGVILLAVQAAFDLSAYANLQTPIHFNPQAMFLVMIAALLFVGLMLMRLVSSFRV